MKRLRIFFTAYYISSGYTVYGQKGIKEQWLLASFFKRIERIEENLGGNG